jgi:hypothetical protein
MAAAAKADSGKTTRLIKRACMVFAVKLGAHLKQHHGKGFEPFPALQALPAKMVQDAATLWDLPKDAARRKLAEACVDACHLDRGDLVVWK